MRSRAGLTLVLVIALTSVVYGSLVMDPVEPARSPAPSISASEAASTTSAPAASIAPTVAPSSTPTLRPVPLERPYPSAPAVRPARDDDLPLAGRGDVPGLLYCDFGLPFTVSSLKNPTGAEDLPGPEYDALRVFL